MDYIITKFIMDKLEEGYTVKQTGYRTFTFKKSNLKIKKNNLKIKKVI